jgi:hypothetical protein
VIDNKIQTSQKKKKKIENGILSMMNYKFEKSILTNDIFPPLKKLFSFREIIFEIFNFFENNMINAE